MRMLTVLVAFVLLCTYARSQSLKPKQVADTTLMEALLKDMKLYEGQFNCKKYIDPVTKKEVNAKVVGSPAFDSIYRLASSRILTSSQDFIKNGKAAALDFNESLKKLTINYSWKGNGNLMWNAGLVAEEGSRKLFEIFGKKGWKEGFTFNGGVVIPSGLGRVLFFPSKCEALREKRRGYYLTLLDSYAKALATDTNQIKNIRARKSRLDSLKKNIIKLDDLSAYRLAPAIVTDAETKLLDLWDKLKGVHLDSIREVYEKDVANFEVANLKDFGYSLKWWNINAAYGLKRYTIYDTAVVGLAKIEKKNQNRFTLTGSWNFFQEAAGKNIFYFSGEVSLGNMSYLEEILPSEITQLKSNTGENMIKEDYDALIVKDYGKLKKGYGFIAPGAVINYFPGTIGGLGRFLGFELAGSAKYKTFVPDGVNARDMFSCRGGLLFTFEKDKVAKTTFGVIASLTDIPFNDITSKDRFGVSIRIGVPFNY